MHDDDKVYRGTRVFEDMYYRFFGRIRPYAPLIGTAFLGAISLKMLTCLYCFEAAALTVLMRASGLRLKRKADYLKLAITITSLVCLIEVLSYNPPMSLFIISSNLASSITYVLGQSAFRWALPNVAGVGYYLMNHDYWFALLSFLYIPIIPLLISGFNKITAVNAVGLLRGFVLSDTLGPEAFERELERLRPEERELKGHVFLFRGRGRGDTFALIVTDAHPGPLGSVGGGKIIDKLKEMSESRGIGILFLHGVGGHENDIIRGDDAVRFAESVINELERLRSASQIGKGAVCRPMTHITESFSLLTLCFEGKRVVIASSRKKSSDDLPYGLSLLEEIYDCIIVDAQNSYLRDNGYGRGEELELKEFLSSTKDGLMPCASARVGYGYVSTEGLDAPRREIGPLGIRSIVIECDGRRTALVSFDGNNMSPALRLKMIEELRGLVDDAEIVTTDNHSTVGLRGRRGYNTIGESIDWSVLIEKARESVERALMGLDEVDVNYSVVRFRAKVLGETNFNKLKAAVLKVPACVSLYLLALVFLPLTLSLLRIV